MGGKVAKDRKKDRITEDRFVNVDKFECDGAYIYQNGDRYRGDWKKGLKHGYGIYTYVNGRSIKGWFYEDGFLGSQPNEKLKKELKKKYNATAGSEPLPPFQSLLSSPPENDSGRETRISTSREDIPATKSYKLPGKKGKSCKKPRAVMRTMRAKYPANQH